MSLAGRIAAEIVSCDSVQVYRELDAATSKPSAEDRARVAHHLVDIVDPRERYTVADYVRDAEAAVREVAARGRVPLVVGGTGLYLRGLLRGIVPSPPPNPVLRRRLVGMASRFGSARLHRWLLRLDADSARRISPRDLQRVTRAIEIALGGGATWSERLRSEGTWSASVERFASLKVGIDMSPEALDARLTSRVGRFYANGLVEELHGLLAAGVSPQANALRAIGYREILSAVLQGHDPVAVRAEIVKSTRRYSRRQRTWFRKEPGIVWLDADAPPDLIADRIVELWRGV
jgi:tRNA dimethylallyltransferase